jgi:hypothetical protein
MEFSKRRVARILCFVVVSVIASRFFCPGSIFVDKHLGDVAYAGS